MLRLTLVVAVGLIASGVDAASFSGMVVFGDSLSDNGNLFSLTEEALPPSPPYFEGRFSDGPVWVENLILRLNADPEQLLNYATGGATSGAANITVPEAPGLLPQIDTFAASGALVDPQALFVVWAGANDFRGNITDPEAVITTAVTNIATGISTLAALGAKAFLVPNLPDLGRVPEVLESGDAAVSAGATALAVAFNEALAPTLDNLEIMLEIDIVPLDVFALFEAVVADPSAYRLENVTDRCLSADQTTVCDSLGYLFWDGRHPTALGHVILANAAADALIDSNGDGILDSIARVLGLDPFVADGDSDGDGTSDVDEVGELDNPVDTDSDGIIDAAEPGDAAADPLALVFRVPEGLPLAEKTVSLVATGANTMTSINNPSVGLPIYTLGELEHEIGVIDGEFAASFLYLLGLYRYILKVDDGGTATVVLQFPPEVSIHEDAVYRIVDTTGNLSTNTVHRNIDTAGHLKTDDDAVIDQANNTVTLTLTDGGGGDEDGAVNGVIVHTGGVGEPFELDFELDLGSGWGGSGCFIATAAYGSYQAPYVMVLRNFRDRFLLPNPVGHWFVEQYYTYSPPAAAWIAQRGGWRTVVRVVLIPLIGVAWLLTEAAAGIQILVGLLFLGMLWRIVRYCRSCFNSPSPLEGRGWGEG